MDYYYELHGQSSDDFYNDSSDDDLSFEEEEENNRQHGVPPEIEKLRKCGLKIQQTDLDELLGILRE